MKSISLLIALIALCLSASCKDRFEHPQTLGGVTISAEVLSRGYTVYSRNCGRCHGSTGNGQTTAKAKDRPPRDLTIGIYKYGSVIDGGLPTDEDLLRILKTGFQSNLMPAYDHLSSSDLDALVQYIKTLAPRWKEDKAGVPITIPANPWTGQKVQAIAAGKRIYHAQAQCWSCHPGYMNAAEINALASPKAISMRPNIGQPKTVKTDYGQLRSPDFKSDTWVAVHTQTDLYRIIATGIPGTPMPSWSDSFSPKELWALVTYVESLQPPD